MTILAVVAHPDDELIGVGGTLAKHVSKGEKVHVVILSKTGISRDNNEICENYPEKRREQARAACKKIGFESLRFHSYPENEFDTVPLLEIVQTIEDEISRVDPEIVYTHHFSDLNISHEYTCRAVMTAARPLPNSNICQVLTFETLSSTEWSSPKASNQFTPRVFVDIEDTLKQKIDALTKYEGELKQHPHPRSVENIRRNAKLWGAKAGLPAAEPFDVLYEIR